MPIHSRSSYSELPEWLRNYAQEAAIAARNLGLQVTPPAQGSPAGTLPTVGVQPYRRYTGERFAPVNPMEKRATELSTLENPLVPSIEKARSVMRHALQRGIGSTERPGALNPYEEAYKRHVISNVADIVPGIPGVPASEGRRAVRARREQFTSKPSPEMNEILLNEFSRPSGTAANRRTTSSIEPQLMASRAQENEDIRHLIAESLERGRAISTQAFNQDLARILESSVSEAERGNLLNLARANDINNLYQTGAYHRTLQERPLAVSEEEFRRAENHPYETLRFLIAALNEAPIETAIHESTTRPEAPSAPRSLHSSDYAGIAAQAAPSAVQALRGEQQAQQQGSANAPARRQESLYGTPERVQGVTQALEQLVNRVALNQASDVRNYQIAPSQQDIEQYKRHLEMSIKDTVPRIIPKEPLKKLSSEEPILSALKDSVLIARGEAIPALNSYSSAQALFPSSLYTRENSNALFKPNEASKAAGEENIKTLVEELRRRGMSLQQIEGEIGSRGLRGISLERFTK